MRSIRRAYDRFITLLAMLGGSLVLVMAALIVYAVAVRALGAQPPQWINTFSEYALLYMTLLAAPWLVRERSNVVVDTLTNALPENARYRLERLVFAVCAALSVILAIYGAALTAGSWNAGDYDIRSVAVPGWVFHVIIPVGFALVAIEFTRQVSERRAFVSSGTGRAGL